jgi:hypothetical protein
MESPVGFRVVTRSPALRTPVDVPVTGTTVGRAADAEVTAVGDAGVTVATVPFGTTRVASSEHAPRTAAS